LYFILYHESLLPILGEPKDFTLNLEDWYDTQKI
jgi:hypothetical protein